MAFNKYLIHLETIKIIVFVSFDKTRTCNGQ
jgi:hypothetical protein